MTLELLFPPIITEEGRKHILNHKYVSGTQSFTQPIFNIWWEFVVQFVPDCIAPNVLTLTGLILQLMAFFTYAYLDPTLSGTYIGFWAYIFLFLCLFWYQTLDAIDGKHARNTKNSSPLGQLFDHGCDALIMNVTVVFVFIGGLQTSWATLYVLINSQIVFFALNWRARHTGQFDFGQFGVDETILIGQFIYLATAFCGTELWTTTVFGWPLNYTIIVPLNASIVQNCIKARHEVNKFYASKEKTQFYHDRFYEIGNLIVFHVSLCLWNLVGIFGEQPILFISIASATFAHLIHRLIIADVTKQKTRKIQYIILPCVAVGLVSVFEYVAQAPVILDVSMADVKVTAAVLCYTTYVMVVYSMRCMIDISNILKIRIFLINPPKVNSS
eukprot:1027936_1